MFFQTLLKSNLACMKIYHTWHSQPHILFTQHYSSLSIHREVDCALGRLPLREIWRAPEPLHTPGLPDCHPRSRHRRRQARGDPPRRPAPLAACSPDSCPGNLCGQTSHISPPQTLLAYMNCIIIHYGYIWSKRDFQGQFENSALKQYISLSFSLSILIFSHLVTCQ